MGTARDDQRPAGSSDAGDTHTRSLELNTVSDPAGLAPLRKTVEHFAEDSAHFDRAAAGELGLCLNEALANVIRHAYDGRTDRPIRVTLETLGDGENVALRVLIRDWGNGVDPSTIPPAPYDPLTPGGVGLICLRTLLDEVVYTAQPDGMLTTLLRRRRRPTLTNQDSSRASGALHD